MAALLLVPVSWQVLARGDTPARAGGATTVEVLGRNAFSMPLATLSDTERTRFAVGNSFFRRNWVEAPASTTARDGLGPHFNARSCGGCHVQDGRGSPPLTEAARQGLQPDIEVGLLMRLSMPGQDAHGGPLPEPHYGDQLSPQAVQGVRAEGQIEVRTEPITGQFQDGTPYTLQRPVYRLTALGYGPLDPAVRMSPRVAPHLAGVGLIEAIPDSELLRNQTEQARRQDGIRGQVNQVWDAPGGRMRLGRWGWKANVGSLLHQTAAAFAGDIGITSRWFGSTCTTTQTDCLAAPAGGQAGQPELAEAVLNDVVFYQAALAPAAWRPSAGGDLALGQRTFDQAQCSTCHRPSYRTGPNPFPGLLPASVAGQLIWPYSDFLLHDMGEALSDGRPDYLASGRQWRTPPLWGVGLIPGVNGHQRLLHDGRAQGVMEAILWHGGEAEGARQAVLRMSAAQRAALVSFVESR